ncbi:phosphatase domain-containing protein [Jatrophihabitans sp. DSM 45814]
MTIAVFDIDGVVADVRHRLHFLDYPQDWDGFFDDAHLDTPLQTGVELVQAQIAEGREIAWLTGRPDWLRRTTVDWLTKFDLPTDELWMRPPHDYRPARFLKVDVLRHLAERDIAIFVDDDPDVIRSARNAGFPVKMATWVPHTKTLREAQEEAGRT